MQNQSEREELIEALKRDKSLRIEIPKEIIEDVDPEEREDYILLAEHRKYLMRKRKESNDSEREELENKIFKVQQYMLIAQFGDKNIGRFTNI